MQRWDVDPLLTEIYDLLYRLGVKATMTGFFETSCALFLVMQKPYNQWFSIMKLYQRISALYHTDLEEIDPRIRRIAKKVWSKRPDDLSRLAGRELRKPPTPRQFIRILQRYLYLRKFR